MPVSAVLADDEIMMTIKAGQHGSTYGGNPLACKVTITALKVLQKENMAANAAVQGNLLRRELSALDNQLISVVRGKGLLNAIVVGHEDKDTAWNLCVELMKNGLLAKPTHGDKIRFAPPLIITSAQVKECVDIINHSICSL